MDAEAGAVKERGAPWQAVHRRGIARQLHDMGAWYAEKRCGYWLATVGIKHRTLYKSLAQDQLVCA